MGTPARSRAPVRIIRRTSRAAEDDAPRRTVSAQLTLSELALARLLSMSGSDTEFILSSRNGRVTVRVTLQVSGVPDAELAMGANGVVVNWALGTVSSGVGTVSLSRMELRLLAALCEHAPHPAAHRELAKWLWPQRGGPVPDAEVRVAVLVCSLRKRLERAGAGDAIRTVRLRGYALVTSDSPNTHH